MRINIVVILIAVLGWYVYLIGESTNRNTAAIGALYARVDTLTVQVEVLKVQVKEKGFGPLPHWLRNVGVRDGVVRVDPTPYVRESVQVEEE